MDNRYELLLSPVSVGGKTLKNRLTSSKCALQGFTIEQAGDFYAGLAKNGAATVTVAFGDYPERDLTHYGEGPHMPGGTGLLMSDPKIRDGFARMADRCHEEGTLVSVSLMDVEPNDVNISDCPNWDEIPKNGDYNSGTFYNKPGISVDRLEQMMDEFAWRCKEAKKLGFDMCTIYMSYRGSILANSMSPVFNQRTDKYGGATMRERTTLTRETFQRIKQACGEDFLIEAQISAYEEAPGYTVEDFLDYCEAMQDLIDIVQIRGVDGSDTHVTGLNLTKGHPATIDYAAAFKARNLRTLCAPVGGYGDPDDMERFLQEGKTDLFGLARQFLADDRYYEKLKAGNGADVIPCARCNDCHGFHTCTVNPRTGRTNLFPAEAAPKKVAVVGGGPAGMQAALTAAQRGHKVTLFEASDSLGGQLKAACVPDFKWPLKDYRDYLIGKVSACGAEVKLNTAATPELLKQGQYDAVICALGSDGKTIPVPGADKGVYLAEDIFGSEAQLGKKVVVIGGQDTGRDAALYLAQAGHEVVWVTRHQCKLHRDMHAERVEKDALNSLPNFSFVDFAETLAVAPGQVTLKVQTNARRSDRLGLGMPDAEDAITAANMQHMMEEGPGGPGGPEGPGGPGGPGGPEGPAPEPEYEQQVITCDAVVISGGRAPRSTDAFMDCAPQVIVVGDAKKSASVKQAIYSAYKAVMLL